MGFEPYGAEVVSCGQGHVGIRVGGRTAQQGGGGSVPPSSMHGPAVLALACPAEPGRVPLSGNLVA